MVTSTKFASLVGTVTLAFILSNSIRPVHTAPVRRQDASDAPAAVAPAGFISVPQPQMSEQDIYAIGIPPPPSSAPESTLQQVLQAAAQAALSTTNRTIEGINHYDATPPVAGAPAAQVASTNTQVAQPASDTGMTGNPDLGSLYQQVNGTPGGDAGMTGNPDLGSLYSQVIGTPAGVPTDSSSGVGYDQVIAQQMSQLGGVAKRQDAAAAPLGVGVPTPSSATMVPSAAVPVESDTATTPSSVADTPAVVTTNSAGVPVAPPVPSDFSSPPVDADIPSTSAVAAAVSASPIAPALPTDAASVAAAPSISASVSDAAVATPSVSAAASDAPTAPSGSASASDVAATPSTAAVSDVPTPPTATPTLPSLADAAEASAATLLPTSNANPSPTSAADVTMTVTLPTKSLPTSLGSPNLANAVDDWKTMTILVPAEAFGGSPPVPTSSSTASSSASVGGDKNAVVTSSASSSTVTPPPNLSSFSPLKPSPTASVLTIPLTGVIDGISYSTMLTLTVPGFGGPATSSLPITSDKAQSATASPTTPSPTSSKAVPTTSVDASYIPSSLIPPLLRSSSTLTPAPTPTGGSAVKDPIDDGEDDCEEEEEDTTAQPKSLLTKVWDWMTGKPLNERDFDDDYGTEDDVWYDAPQE